VSAVFDPDTLAAPTLRRHRIDIAAYYRMAETGFFKPDARVELIEGEVIDMAPMGSRHWRAVSALNEQLVRAIGDRAEVNCQLPLRLSDHTEPVPDFSVLKTGTRRALGDRLPGGDTALLVIEVADSSLSYDARVKAPLYAASGVAEYWILDLEARALHRFAGASLGDWRSKTTQPQPGRVELPGLAGVSIDLATVF
jgi:Uma2 family endonuclease